MIEINLKGRDLLTLRELKREEICFLMDQALKLKKRGSEKGLIQALKGKIVALVFHKPSTRTRVSFEGAIFQLGAHPVYLTASDLQLGRGETVEDTGRVLSRYVEAIVIRTFSQLEVERLAAAASVPVINALTDEYHPCQALADLLTILEKRGGLAGCKLAYVGDGNNVCHSLMIASATCGMDLRVATPPKYEPDREVAKLARERIKESKGKIKITNNPVEAVSNADFVYTDVWASMGQESEHKERVKEFATYQINKELLSYAKKDALVMHCLPAHRGEEITNEVIDSSKSIVFDQAENRLHIQKALLLQLLVG